MYRKTSNFGLDGAHHQAKVNSMALMENLEYEIIYAVVRLASLFVCCLHWCTNYQLSDC